MAIFTIAGRRDEPNVYPEIKDLEGLIAYCANHCVGVVTNNLYDLSLRALVNQMIFLQKCKGTKLRTRALHFILSFENRECGVVENRKQVLTGMLYTLLPILFPRNQAMAFIHNDKVGRMDVHMIVNPVEMNNMKIYHCSPHNFKLMQRDIARVLFASMQTDLCGTSYMGIHNGKLVIREGEPKDKVDYEQQKYFDFWEYNR